MDNPDTPCETVLSDDLLLDYLHAVREKTLAYLDSLTNDELNDCPENCEYTRLELILMQFRHISVHTGMLNGQTIERTGRFPVYVGPTDSSARLSNGHFEERGARPREEASEASDVGVREVCRKKRLPKRGVVVSAEEQAIEKAAADADEGVS